MMAKPLAQQATQQAAGFKKPDISAMIPPESKDAVDRVVAAGTKMMYAPEMRQHLQEAVQSQDPVPKKLAENTVGLMLLLDQKSQGKIPLDAMFPAAMELLGEAAEVLTTVGQDVTQEDYNEAAMMMFAIMGKKLGATDEQMMGAAEQAIPGGGGDGEAAPPPDNENAEPPGPEEQPEEPGAMP